MTLDGVRAYYVGGKEAYCLHFEPGGDRFPCSRGETYYMILHGVE